MDEARAARRRLAKQLHPDLHAARSAAERAELARRMTQVNLAVAALESGASPEPPSSPVPPDPPVPQEAPVHPPAHPLEGDSLTVEALPAEAFEALFLVAYGLGEILVADEPYLMEAYLSEPAPCFCRLTLVPVAGGSIVTVDVEPAEDDEPPPVLAVRDLLVAELDRLAYSKGRSGHQG
jgi:hypothetical protein